MQCTLREASSSLSCGTSAVSFTPCTRSAPHSPHSAHPAASGAACPGSASLTCPLWVVAVGWEADRGSLCYPSERRQVPSAGRRARLSAADGHRQPRGLRQPTQGRGGGGQSGRLRRSAAALSQWIPLPPGAHRHHPYTSPHINPHRSALTLLCLCCTVELLSSSTRRPISEPTSGEAALRTAAASPSASSTS